MKTTTDTTHSDILNIALPAAFTTNVVQQNNIVGKKTNAGSSAFYLLLFLTSSQNIYVRKCAQ